MAIPTGSEIRWMAGLLLALFCVAAQAQRLTLPLTDREKDLTVYFASPTGAGDQSGSSQANALPLTRLEPFIRDLEQSARIVMLPGQYTLGSTLDLIADNANQILVLEGQEGTVIQGNFDPQTMAGISSGLRLRSGNIIVRGIRFRQTAFCIKADRNATIDQVLIENIVAENTHTCILVDRDVQLPVTRWIIRNAHINGYYRSGIRLAGMQSGTMLIEDVHLDGAQPIKSECYKSGIQLVAGVSDIHIRNASVKNNIGDCGDGYQQGDGIEADHKEGTPRNIRLENVRIANSGDADLDLKAQNVTLHRVIALGGPGTRVAFKLWGYEYSCSQCYAFGANAALIQLIQARLTLTSSILSNDQPVHVCDLRHGVTPEEQSQVRFENAQVYLANEEWIDECGNGALAAVKRIPMGRVAPPHPPDI